MKQKQLPTGAQLNQLIERLAEPISTAVWLAAVSSVHPEELAFKWKDLDVGKRMLWIERAVNRGKLLRVIPDEKIKMMPIAGNAERVEYALAQKAAADRGQVKRGERSHNSLIYPFIRWPKSYFPVPDESCSGTKGVIHVIFEGSTWRKSGSC